jgi:UDP-N-acetylglucosamine 1-carboxyvinyltransferase
MASFIIEGGHKLHGEITPQGAKNEALEVISAILLTAEPVIIRNVPNILDVNNLIGLLSKMGVRVTDLGDHAWQFQADHLDMEYLGGQEFVQRCQALRGSILVLGPLLARFHKACVAKPGGDQIGRRRLDTHFLGIQELGAKFNYCVERGVL